MLLEQIVQDTVSMFFDAEASHKDSFRFVFKNVKTKRGVVVAHNSLKVVPYLVCKCNKDKSCPKCGGRGSLYGLVNGKLVADRYDEETNQLLAKGTRIHFSPTQRKLSLSAGMTPFIQGAKEIDNKGYPKGSDGKTYDRYVLSLPYFEDRREKQALVAAMLCHVRDLIETSDFPYICIPSKGGQLVMATLDAWREIYPEWRDGKIIKGIGYKAGNYLFKNISENNIVTVAVLKNEWKRNGLMELCTQIVIDEKEYGAVAIRDFHSGVKKGTIRSISESELYLSKLFLNIEEDIDGITTEEMIKGLDSSKVIFENDKYYILTFNLQDILVVAPPIRTGLPRFGLSLWKYGESCLGLSKYILEQSKLNQSIRWFKLALEGDFDAICRVLGLRTPSPEDTSQIPGFCFSIFDLEEKKPIWYNPRGTRSQKKMFTRFISYYRNHIMIPETEGLKEIVASSGILMDEFDAAYVKWAEKNNKELYLFAILPDMKIGTDIGKISMEKALSDRNKGFIFKKDPIGAAMQMLPIEPLLDEEFAHFLVYGEYLPVGGTPILGKRGCIILPSRWTKIACMPDFDGDKGSLHYMPKELRPTLPPVTEWTEEFASGVPSGFVNLEDEYSALKYYSNLAVTIYAAQTGVIGPMVNGSVAAAFTTIATLVESGRIDKMNAQHWHSLQKTWAAIAEIFAIKKQKTMADGSVRLRDWTKCVDQSIELRNEGYDLSLKIKNNEDPSEEMVDKERFYMSLLNPRGDISYLDEEDRMVEETSDDPYDILVSLIEKADIVESELGFVEKWFPIISIVKQFKGIKIMERSDQWVEPDAKMYSDMKCDSQRQHFILQRALGIFLKDKGLTMEQIESFRSVVRTWINKTRKVYTDSIEIYGYEDSIEKSEFVHRGYAEAMEYALRLGFSDKNIEKPWIFGPVTNKDRATLFTLLVGCMDSEYRVDGNGYYSEGTMSSFNRCPKEGITSVLHLYFSAICTLTVGEIDGTEDDTRVDTLPGFHLPLWYTGGEQFKYYQEWIETEEDSPF